MGTQRATFQAVETMRALPTKSMRSRKPLRLGFIALCDCAPLVMARELGLYAKYGLRVELKREVGWATIRDKIVYRELDGAHALAPMVFAATFGLGSIQADCVSGLVLCSEGNALTLARSLRAAGTPLGQSLRQHVMERGAPLVLGIPFLYSSHNFLLRLWTRANGLDWKRDIQLAIVPPPQMAGNLKSSHFDGYCVGEPWNTVAVASGFGWRAATSADIAPWHPEKVLMVRREFAEARADEHEGLIAALLEACRFCAAPENRERIVEVLSAPDCLNSPKVIVRDSLASLGQFSDFSPEAHEPSRKNAAWVLDNMIDSGLLSKSPENRKAAAKVFRPDIFHNAIRNHLDRELTSAVS